MFMKKHSVTHQSLHVVVHKKPELRITVFFSEILTFCDGEIKCRQEKRAWIKTKNKCGLSYSFFSVPCQVFMDAL